jgi:tetratricopeptide (TPR) repeat protein
MEHRIDRSESQQDGQEHKNRTWFLWPNYRPLKTISSKITECFGLADNSQNQDERIETGGSNGYEINRSSERKHVQGLGSRISRMLCCLDPRRADQWHELQKRRQQGIGRGRELLAQLQGSTQDMLCGLRGLTKQVDLGAMDAAQLNEYAQRLERKLNPWWGETNLEQLVTKALDVQRYAQERLESGLNGADGNDMESARNTASEIIQRGLNAMSPAQVKEYVEGLKRGAQTDRVQFVTNVLDIQMYVQNRLENTYRIKTDDKNNLESARNKASEIIQQELNAMDGTQLNKYAQRLEHKLKGTNLGQIVTRALDVQMYAQERLESGLNGTDGNDLESARGKASEVIRQGLDAMSPAQLKEYVYGSKREKLESTRVSKMKIYVYERLDKNPSDWESYLKIVGKAGISKALYENACEIKSKLSILEKNKQGRNEEVINQLNGLASVLYKCINSNYEFTMFVQEAEELRKAQTYVAEVKMSISDMQLTDLKQRVSSEITKEQPNLALLKQLKEEAEQLRHRERVDPNEFYLEKEKIQRWHFRDKAITDGAGRIVTNELKGAFDKIWGSQSNFQDRERAKKHYQEGLAFAKLGDYQKAVAAFSKVIDLNPYDADAHYQKGLAFAKLEDDQEAMTALSEAIDLNPDHADAYYQRGNAFSKLKKYREAAADYGEATCLKPGLARAYHEMVGELFKLKDYQIAVEAFQEFIKRNPEHVEAYYQMGLAHAELKDHREAVEVFQKVIDLNPNHADAYYQMGLAHAELGDHRGVVEAFRARTRLNPNHADAYYQIALAHYNLNEKGHAFEACINAIKQDKRHIRANALGIQIYNDLVR